MVLRAASESNCLIALFLGKADVVFSTCKRLVLNETFEPVWIRHQMQITGFIVSVLLNGSLYSVRDLLQSMK
jgi:hypothetical protein